MAQLKNIRWLPVIMAITIIGITVFQVYWLKNTYERERRALEIRTNMMFRETIYKLQASKLRIDSLLFDSASNKTASNSTRPDKDLHVRVIPRQKMIGLMNVLKEKAKSSSNSKEMYALEKKLIINKKSGERRFQKKQAVRFFI